MEFVVPVVSIYTPSNNEKMMKSNIKIIKKWKKWIDEIIEDVTDLVENRYVFNEIVSICKKNRELSKDNLFWDFLKSNYIASMVSGVCRQVDTDKNTSSFINLLNEIFKNPEAITKKWFAAQYPKNKVGYLGKATFKSRFGRGNFVDPVKVHSDIGKLLYYTWEIKKFRNKKIAHKDKKRKLKINASFTDLNKAIDILEQIALKYNLLLNQSAYANNTLLPTIQYDWKKIFKSPWIKK